MVYFDNQIKTLKIKFNLKSDIIKKIYIIHIIMFIENDEI